MINGFHTPRLGHLKPNLTYLCDRGCYNCNRATKLAPSSTEEDLDPNQFAHMLLDESPKANKKWNHIVLTGGEPTIHPQFSQFVDVLVEYKKIQPSCIIATYTYHHPKFFYKIEEALAKHRDLFLVYDTGKTKPRVHRWATYLAPIDDPNFGPSYRYNGCHMGCHICGLGYDRKGFFCCPIAATIARVFDLDTSIKEVRQFSTGNVVEDRKPFLDQYPIFCPKCGFFNSARARKEKEFISPTWKRAFEAYRLKHPDRVWPPKL